MAAILSPIVRVEFTVYAILIVTAVGLTVSLTRDLTLRHHDDACRHDSLPAIFPWLGPSMDDHDYQWRHFRNAAPKLAAFFSAVAAAVYVVRRVSTPERLAQVLAVFGIVWVMVLHGRGGPVALALQLFTFFFTKLEGPLTAPTTASASLTSPTARRIPDEKPTPNSKGAQQNRDPSPQCQEKTKASDSKLQRALGTLRRWLVIPRPVFLPLLWAMHISFLLYTEYSRGWHWLLEAQGAPLLFLLDWFGHGIMRWFAQWNMSMLRLISYTYDRHEAVGLQQEHYRRCAASKQESEAESAALMETASSSKADGESSRMSHRKGATSEGWHSSPVPQTTTAATKANDDCALYQRPDPSYPCSPSPDPDPVPLPDLDLEEVGGVPAAPATAALGLDGKPIAGTTAPGDLEANRENSCDGNSDDHAVNGASKVPLWRGLDLKGSSAAADSRTEYHRAIIARHSRQCPDCAEIKAPCLKLRTILPRPCGAPTMMSSSNHYQPTHTTTATNGAHLHDTMAMNTSSFSSAVCRDEYGSLARYLAYMNFPALYVAGPLVSFNAFSSQLNSPQRRFATPRELGLYAFRTVMSYVMLQAFLHVAHVNCINNRGLLATLSPGEYASVGYLTLGFLWLKFNVMWKFFRFMALLSGIEAPEDMPQCFSNTTTVADFWRGWHASFNAWIVRYMYVPMGGRNARFLTVVPIFLFVAMWHDTSLNLLTWALLMVAAFIPELVVQALAGRYLRHLKAKWYWRHLAAAAATTSTLTLIVANLYGYGTKMASSDGVVAIVDFRRTWHIILFMLVSLFAECSVSAALRRRKDAQHQARLRRCGIPADDANHRR